MSFGRGSLALLLAGALLFTGCSLVKKEPKETALGEIQEASPEVEQLDQKKREEGQAVKTEPLPEEKDNKNIQDKVRVEDTKSETFKLIIAEYIGGDTRVMRVRADIQFLTKDTNRHILLTAYRKGHDGKPEVLGTSDLYTLQTDQPKVNFTLVYHMPSDVSYQDILYWTLKAETETPKSP